MSERIQHAGLIIELSYDTSCPSPLDMGDTNPEVVRFDDGYENPGEKAGFRSVKDVRRATLCHGAIAFGMWGGGWGSQGTSFDVRYSENPYADEDMGRENYGFVVFTKEMRERCGLMDYTREQLYEYAVSSVEEYEKWCNGEVYWIDIQNAIGDSLEDAGGYIGYDYAVEAAKEMAEYAAKAEAERMKTYTATKLDEDGDEEEETVEAVSMKDALRQLDFEPLKLELTA